MVRTIKKIKRKTARIIVKRRMRSRNNLTLKQEKVRRKRMSTLLLIMAGLLVFLPSFVWLRHKFQKADIKQETIEINQELFSLGNIIYRHYIGYGEYCQKQGYRLTVYPNVFYQTYQNDLLVFGQIARQNGFTPDRILEKTKKEFAAVSERAIEREFKLLIQKRFQNTDGSVLQTQEDICRYIDAQPDAWLNSHKERLQGMQQSINALKKQID